ncbi:MAG TPA: hypothetical protein ENI96_05310 [Sedimenticola thiotaurini]|uniref:Uncharacterized protein n=1 Tax=Sedimenticola thiotaurini TaxID=1543721 RepID=A0A831RMV3_9GAMM|nr:hypothetical protein [Sedimenticola thiotaurini]
MSSNRKKEIENLRSRLAELEALDKLEQKRKEVLEKAHAQLTETLATAEATLDDFVRHLHRDFKRIFGRIEREKAKSAPAKKKTGVKKKATAKKKRARRKTAKVTVKIPAGRYGNIPDAPDQVFEVKEKGARPKVLKAYAEKVGLEKLMRENRLPDEE